MTGSLLSVRGLEKTDDRFRSALVRQALAAQMDADAIAVVISLESGFDANIQNREGHNMLGLIQFWRDGFPAVARKAGLDVRWEDLRTMDAASQVPLVIAYYQLTPIKPTSSPTDYYVATIMPYFVGKPDETIMAEQGSTVPVVPGSSKTRGQIYAANRVLDTNKDGVITVSDLRRTVEGVISNANQRPRTVVLDVPDSYSPASAGFGGVGVALAGVFFFTC